MRNDEELNKHPGWAVRFEDDTWLGGGHGWFRCDASEADIYDTKEHAAQCLAIVQAGKYDQHFDLKAEIVEAWQPLCESLRCRVRLLRQDLTVDVSSVRDTIWELENVLEDLKAATKRSG